MIFRTGSVLIVGHANEDILHVIYNFLKKVLIEEYYEIFQNCDIVENDKIKEIKPRKKTIKVKI